MKITIAYRDRNGNIEQELCPWAHAIRQRSRSLRWESRACELVEDATFWNSDGLAEYERQIVLDYFATIRRVSVFVEACSHSLLRVIDNRACELCFLQQASDAIRHYDLVEYCRQEFGIVPPVEPNRTPDEYEKLFEKWEKDLLSQDDEFVRLVSHIEYAHILAEAVIGVAGHTIINELKISERLKDMSGAMHLVMCDFARHRLLAAGIIRILKGSWTSKKKKAQREKLIADVKSCVGSACAYVERVCTEQAIPAETIDAVCLEIRRSADFTLDQFDIPCQFKTDGSPAWIKVVDMFEDAAQEYDEFMDEAMEKVAASSLAEVRKQVE